MLRLMDYFRETINDRIKLHNEKIDHFDSLFSSNEKEALPHIESLKSFLIDGPIVDIRKIEEIPGIEEVYNFFFIHEALEAFLVELKQKGYESDAQILSDKMHNLKIRIDLFSARIEPLIKKLEFNRDKKQVRDNIEEMKIKTDEQKVVITSCHIKGNESQAKNQKLEEKLKQKDEEITNYQSEIEQLREENVRLKGVERKFEAQEKQKIEEVVALNTIRRQMVSSVIIAPRVCFKYSHEEISASSSSSIRMKTE